MWFTGGGYRQHNHRSPHHPAGTGSAHQDDSVVIVASSVAPIVPTGPPSGAHSPPGQGPGGAGGLGLHHVNHHGGSASSSAHGGSAYQRQAAALAAATALTQHVDGAAAGPGPGPHGGPPGGAAASAPAAALAVSRRGALCDGGLPDPDMCDLAEESGPPSARPVVEEALSRGRWLLGLLIVQSTSSFVLDSYQDLLRDHLVVTLFLTMLVGAGGNAGNQSAIKVIRGLATGVILPSWRSAAAVLREQVGVGLLLGTGLAAGGFVRVYATHGDAANAAAISASLFLIVLTSVVLGAGLPFVLARAGVDPANAGTSIQVLMDILGVAITCAVCQVVLVQLAGGLAAAGAITG